MSGKKLVDLQIDEVSLVKKGFKPVHQDATIEFFKAHPDNQTPAEQPEGGFFSRIRKAFEVITKGVVADKVNNTRPQREINEALWAMSDALDEIRWGYGSAYGLTDEQKRQAMHDVIDEGTKMMHESVDKIGQTSVSKAMDTNSGANYEKKDISTNSPSKKKKNQEDPDDDGDIDTEDPALDTDNDKGKGKVKKSMNAEEIQKAIQDGLTSIPETIKKAVEEAAKPHQEAIAKAQTDLTAAVEKATSDINTLVETAKTSLTKAVDDAKIDLGRVAKSTPTPTPAPETPVIKADTSFGDAIRTLMNSDKQA